MTCLNIPSSVRDRIPKHCNCDDKQQERDEYIHYYRKYSPYSLWGWEYLGGELHYLGQEAALTAAKAYIQKAPGTCECDMCQCVCIGILEDSCDHVYIHSKIHTCSEL